MKKSFKSYGIIGATILLIAVFFSINTNNCFAADKDKSIQCYKEIAKTVVHATALGLGEILKDVKTEDERIALIRAFVNPIRFYPDNSGYFYNNHFINCRTLVQIRCTLGRT
ncbi:MAG: hypothetical protein WA096_11175 [Smithella sp.]